MPQPRQRTERGFTLVEVLVVLTVIGILLATTIPNYLQARPSRFMSQTTNNLAANLNFARTTAIKDNAPTYVEFLPELDMYRVWDEAGWKEYARPNQVTGNSVNPPPSPDRLPAPLKEQSPQLRYSITALSITFLERNYSTERAVASYGGIPDDVDIRMQPYSCFGQASNTSKLVARNFMLSRQPLMFIKYFPDGRCADSWSQPCSVSVGAIPRLIAPNLGFSEITLQVRGGFNGASAMDFIPNTNQIGDNDNNAAAAPFPQQNLTPNQSLPYTAATSDDNGRRILLNHANGRVTVEAYAPYLIDVPGGEDTNPNWKSANNNKEWI